MSDEIIEGQNLVEAIEAMDGVVEAARAVTETVQAVGDRLDRYVDYYAMDDYPTMANDLASVAANEVAQEVDQGVLQALRPELQPVIHVTAESMVSIQPMTEPLGATIEPWFAPDGIIRAADRIADIRLPDEPLQENTDLNAAPPEPILNIRGTAVGRNAMVVGRNAMVSATSATAVDRNDGFDGSGSVSSSEPPSVEPVTLTGGLGVGLNPIVFSSWNSSAINWGSISYGSSSRPLFEVAKSKIKPKPILNPKTVTRRVLNMAEEGWVVQ